MDKINDLFSNIIAKPKYSLDYDSLLAQKVGFVRTIILVYYHFNRFTDEKVGIVITSLSRMLQNWDPEKDREIELLKKLDAEDPSFKELVLFYVKIL